MVENKYSAYKFLVGVFLLALGFCGLFFQESLHRAYSAGFLLIGFLFFSFGFDGLAKLEYLGRPILFHRLKRGLVYEVVAKTSAPNLIIIMGPEKQSTMIVIPPFLEKDLKEGERFVRVDMLTITKVS